MPSTPPVKTLLEGLQSDDANVRTQAWLSAGDYQAEAVAPVAQLFAAMDAQVHQLVQQNAAREKIEYPLEVGRAAKRALWKIVRTVGSPGAEGKAATVQQLVELLADDRPVVVRREALWMISEIGDGGEVAEPVARLLRHEDLRDDARMVLERIPGDESLAALRQGLETLPEDFRLAIAQSLRNRGVEVDENRYPCQKMIPTRSTRVKPVQA